MGASLRAGLARLATARRADLALVTLVDLPDVTAEVMARVLAAAVGRAGRARAGGLRRGARPPGRASAATTGPPWPRAPAATAAPATTCARPPHLLVECGDLATGRDVDTAEDLEREDDGARERTRATAGRGRVYAHGHDPDPRFSLANERTFLAWVRTGLALVAGAAAVDALDLPLPDAVQTAPRGRARRSRRSLTARRRVARLGRAPSGRCARGRPCPANPAMLVVLVAVGLAAVVLGVASLVGG